jgi:hypothetical protein
MFASKFIAEVEHKFNVAFVVEGGHVRVRRSKNLPQGIRVSVLRYQQALRTWLADGKDLELDHQKFNDDQLTALGCVQILAEEIFHADGTVTQRWSWTSAEGGDEHFEKILVGLIDAGELIEKRKQAEEASKEAVWSKQHPPKGRLFGRPIGRIPGL